MFNFKLWKDGGQIFSAIHVVFQKSLNSLIFRTYHKIICLLQVFFYVKLFFRVVRILSVQPLPMHSARYKCLQLDILNNDSLQGTVYPAGNHTDPPFVPAPFALPHQGDSMLYLGVSSYFLKSASLAYYRAGALNIIISENVSIIWCNRIKNISSMGSQQRRLTHYVCHFTQIWVTPLARAIHFICHCLK